MHVKFYVYFLASTALLGIQETHLYASAGVRSITVPEARNLGRFCFIEDAKAKGRFERIFGVVNPLPTTSECLKKLATRHTTPSNREKIEKNKGIKFDSDALEAFRKAYEDLEAYEKARHQAYDAASPEEKAAA